MNIQATTFRTSDINLAAFIKASGGKILTISTDDAEKRHFFFEFEDADFCNKKKYDFMNNGDVPGKELLEARDMFIGEVKSIGRPARTTDMNYSLSLAKRIVDILFPKSYDTKGIELLYLTSYGEMSVEKMYELVRKVIDKKV